MTVDELSEYGMARMDDGEIRGFLSSHGVGVLGLPDDGAPSLRPMSYGYDGERALYLLYVLGGDSRKADLSDRADDARFLAYSVETPFNWRSVLCTGHIERVPESEREAVREAVDLAWRPELFERADGGMATALYRFDVEAWTGLKHLGLPPGLEE